MASAVGDPRVEPAVEEVGDQVEGTTRHENTKVMAMITGVSLDRIDAMSSEPMPGTRKICSVTTAPVKMVRDLERDQRDHRDEGVADHVLDDGHPLGQALGARGVDVVEADHVEHGRAHEARPGGALEEPSTATGMMACLNVLPRTSASPVALMSAR